MNQVCFTAGALKLRHIDLLRYLTMPSAILDYNQHALCSRIGGEEDSSISSFTSHKLSAKKMI
jgi:hypothetical protein